MFVLKTAANRVVSNGESTFSWKCEFSRAKRAK
jgi:hypothetical protein